MKLVVDERYRGYFSIFENLTRFLNRGYILQNILITSHTSNTVSMENKRKVKGQKVQEELDELFYLIAEKQLKADYRKSLGKEYARRNWDIEIKKIFKKKE